MGGWALPICASNQREYTLSTAADMSIRILNCNDSYNPYTEPSMEIFSYHKGLNKLIEIGNSGIFRPEMLEVCGTV